MAPFVVVAPVLGPAARPHTRRPAPAVRAVDARPGVAVPGHGRARPQPVAVPARVRDPRAVEGPGGREELARAGRRDRQGRAGRRQLAARDHLGRRRRDRGAVRGRGRSRSSARRGCCGSARSSSSSARSRRSGSRAATKVGRDETPDERGAPARAEHRRRRGPRWRVLARRRRLLHVLRRVRAEEAARARVDVRRRDHRERGRRRRSARCIAPVLRKKVREEWILAGALLVPALPLVFAARYVRASRARRCRPRRSRRRPRAAGSRSTACCSATAPRRRAAARSPGSRPASSSCGSRAALLAVLFPGGGAGGIFLVARRAAVRRALVRRRRPAPACVAKTADGTAACRARTSGCRSKIRAVDGRRARAPARRRRARLRRRRPHAPTRRAAGRRASSTGHASRSTATRSSASSRNVLVRAHDARRRVDPGGRGVMGRGAADASPARRADADDRGAARRRARTRTNRSSILTASESVDLRPLRLRRRDMAARPHRRTRRASSSRDARARRWAGCGCSIATRPRRCCPQMYERDARPRAGHGLAARLLVADGVLGQLRAEGQGVLHRGAHRRRTATTTATSRTRSTANGTAGCPTAGCSICDMQARRPATRTSRCGGTSSASTSSARSPRRTRRSTIRSGTWSPTAGGCASTTSTTASGSRRSIRRRMLAARRVHDHRPARRSRCTRPTAPRTCSRSTAAPTARQCTPTTEPARLVCTTAMLGACVARRQPLERARRRGPRRGRRAPRRSRAPTRCSSRTPAARACSATSSGHASGRSMRASQRPGASSSASRRDHRLARPQPVELVERAVAALHDAAAERDAGVVVVAVELEAEQAVDERAGLAALEAVPAQRFVDPGVRRDHPLAERGDDDVGVALEHRRRSVAAPRAAAPGARMRIAPSRTSGSDELLEARHRRRIGRIEMRRSWRFERVGLHLVRADVVGREPHEPLAHPRHRALRAVHDLAERERVAKLVGRQRPLLGERVDVARRRSSSVGLARRAGAAGRTGRARGARGSRSSSPTTRRAASARAAASTSPKNASGENIARLGRRVVGRARLTACERAPRVTRAPVRARRASTRAHVARSTQRDGTVSAAEIVGRLRDRELHGAHDVVERADRAPDAISGSGRCSPVSRSSVRRRLARCCARSPC